MNTDEPWPDADTAWWRVLKIQTKLHQWAIDDPDRRFDDLYNLVDDPAVLVDAWHRVKGTGEHARRGWMAKRPSTSLSCVARRASSPNCGPN